MSHVACTRHVPCTRTGRDGTEMAQNQIAKGDMGRIGFESQDRSITPCALPHSHAVVKLSFRSLCAYGSGPLGAQCAAFPCASRGPLTTHMRMSGRWQSSVTGREHARRGKAEGREGVREQVSHHHCKAASRAYT